MAEPPIARALISVSDKAGVVELARFLQQNGVEILSTGGTAKTLREAGIKLRDVAEVTGFPEIMDGRVKTLHPLIHGGILARRDLADHRAAMKTHGIGAIDLVVSNLYPFAATVAKGASREDCIENIDIGGPALIRASAKNHEFVAIVTDPADYAAVINDMTANKGATTLALRRRLAAAAYAHTAGYDSMISQWMAAQENETFPKSIVFAGERKQQLRYGENPHQAAAFYVAKEPGRAPRPGIATATQLQGKELSYNNLNDTDAAYELAAEFETPACAIIKHANPCGVAVAGDLATAFKRALACDPVSAFGGIIAVNRPLDLATVEAIGKLFVEVIIAPAINADARAALAQKQNLRVLDAGAMPDPAASGNHPPLGCRRLAAADTGQRPDRRRRSEAGHEARAIRRRAQRSALRLPRRQACEVQRHRLCQGRRHRRHRRRADEPRGFLAHRRLEGPRVRRRRGREGAAHQGLRRRLRRLLPLRRRADGRRRSRRHRRDPARRQHARRRNHRRRRPGRHRHGVHGHPAFPALERDGLAETRKLSNAISHSAASRLRVSPMLLEAP